MKITAILSFLMYALSGCGLCPAATVREYRIVRTAAEHANEQQRLISAIIRVESSGNDSAIGDGGKAVGCLQIHPIMVREVNRIAGTSYTLEDRTSRKKSIEMFTIYTNHYTPCWNPEIVARRWNGGPKGEKKQSTIAYWKKVKVNYERQ